MGHQMLLMMMMTLLLLLLLKKWVEGVVGLVSWQAPPHLELRQH